MSELTQEKVNEIVQERLKREKAKHEKEVEQLKARIAELEGGAPEEVTEEVEEHTAEEPQEQTELSEEEQEEYKQRYFTALKQKALLDAGFTVDQLDRYTSYVKGDTPEEIERNAYELSQEITGGVSSVDPSSKPKTNEEWNPFA